MDTDLKNFIETNRATGKSRKLDRFAEQITTLKDLGFSDSDVLRFLSEKKRRGCQPAYAYALHQAEQDHDEGASVQKTCGRISQAAEIRGCPQHSGAV